MGNRSKGFFGGVTAFAVSAVGTLTACDSLNKGVIGVAQTSSDSTIVPSSAKAPAATPSKAPTPKATVSPSSNPSASPSPKPSASASPVAAAPGTTSSLWGSNGSKWDPAARLPDFSYAGYHFGEAEIPVIAVTANVKDFGAKGDGKADDTAAVDAAIAATASGAILFPAGTYRLTNQILVKKSKIVLRGEGKAKTILQFEKNLTDLFGKNPSSLGISNWSWGGGLVSFEGNLLEGALVGKATQTSPRGSKTLVLNSVNGLKAGTWIRLKMTDPAVGSGEEGSLMEELHAGQMKGSVKLFGKELVRFTSRVEAVDGNTVTLERPLPVEVQAIWNPTVYKFAPTLQEVGVEHLQVSFPEVVYPGHWKEKGFNGIDFDRVANGWIDDVEIHNADSGIFIENSVATTVRGVVISAFAGRKEPGTFMNGHHGITVTSKSSDDLVTGFSVGVKFYHDLTVDALAMLNVFESGSGVDLCMDHHTQAPYSNLFTDLDMGAGNRPYVSSGSQFPQTAAYATFWNIRASKTMTLPKVSFGPYMTFVGVSVAPTATVPDTMHWFLEQIDATKLSPQNLRKGQLERRLKGNYP